MNHKWGIFLRIIEPYVVLFLDIPYLNPYPVLKGPVSMTSEHLVVQDRGE